MRKLYTQRILKSEQLNPILRKEKTKIVIMKQIENSKSFLNFLTYYYYFWSSRANNNNKR